MRAIVISDCHGQPHLVSNALAHAEYDPRTDRLIFAGDLLDIGFDAEKCLKLLHENNAEMLVGNHEAAIVLDKFIAPQDPYSWRLYDELKSIPFKAAAVHDGVLITHAGLSEIYFPDEYDVDVVKESLNKETLIDLWNNDNILWYRPDDRMPHPGIVQVVGHTPPSYCRPIKNFYMVDPFTHKNFGKKRYRYASIENGEVAIADSNYRIS